MIYYNFIFNCWVSAINIIITRIYFRCVCEFSSQLLLWLFIVCSIFHAFCGWKKNCSASVPFACLPWHCLMFIVQFPYMLINFPVYLMVSKGVAGWEAGESGKWLGFFHRFVSHTFIFVQHGFSYICDSYEILNKLKISIIYINMYRPLHKNRLCLFYNGCLIIEIPF